MRLTVIAARLGMYLVPEPYGDDRRAGDRPVCRYDVTAPRGVVDAQIIDAVVNYASDAWSLSATAACGLRGALSPSTGMARPELASVRSALRTSQSASPSQ